NGTSLFKRSTATNATCSFIEIVRACVAGSVKRSGFFGMPDGTKQSGCDRSTFGFKQRQDCNHDIIGRSPQGVSCRPRSARKTPHHRLYRPLRQGHLARSKLRARGVESSKCFAYGEGVFRTSEKGSRPV